MNKKQLIELCSSFHLPCSGKKAKLKAQLRAFSRDRDRWRRYVPALPLPPSLFVSSSFTYCNFGSSPHALSPRPLAAPLLLAWPSPRVASRRVLSCLVTTRVVSCRRRSAPRLASRLLSCCVVAPRVVSCRVVSSPLVSSPLPSSPLLVAFRRVSSPLPISSRLVSSRLVSSRLVSFRFVSFRFVSFRFVSFRFVSFRFVSFRFVSFRFVSFRLLSSLVLALCPHVSSRVLTSSHHTTPASFPVHASITRDPGPRRLPKSGRLKSDRRSAESCSLPRCPRQARDRDSSCPRSDRGTIGRPRKEGPYSNGWVLLQFFTFFESATHTG